MKPSVTGCFLNLTTWVVTNVELVRLDKRRGVTNCDENGLETEKKGWKQQRQEEKEIKGEGEGRERRESRRKGGSTEVDMT